MDIETIKVWLQAINMLGTFALGVWLYLEKRSDKTNERVEKLEGVVGNIKQQVTETKAACDGCQVGALTGDIGQLEKDVAAMKSASESAPNHSDIGKVYESVNDLAEKVDKLVGRFEEQSAVLHKLLNRVIEKGMP